MENRNLFIVYTPFMCMTAIALSMSYLREPSDIYIVNDFTESKQIVHKIMECNLFELVKEIDLKQFKSRIQRAKALFSPYVFYKANGIDIRRNYYTNIITNKVYGDIEDIVLYFNKNASIILYDEGYATYLKEYLEDVSIKHRLIRKVSHLFYRRPYTHTAIIEIYLYEPRLLEHKMPFDVKHLDVNKIEDYHKYLEIINYVFSVNSCIHEYDVKYIFFEESFANDLNNNTDLTIIRLIASCIDSDEFIIKLHPRDKSNRFAKLGIMTNYTMNVPWEAIAIQQINSDKVYITFSSGAVINYLFFNGNNSKTILLYKLEGQEYISMTDEKTRWFSKFAELYGKNLYTPETIDELKTILNSN